MLPERELKDFAGCTIEKITIGQTNGYDFIQITTKEGHCLTATEIGQDGELKILQVTVPT